MKRSTDRILTTHVGSLPRPDDLLALMAARMDGKPVDSGAYDSTLRHATELMNAVFSASGSSFAGS